MLNSQLSERSIEILRQLFRSTRPVITRDFTSSTDRRIILNLKRAGYIPKEGPANGPGALYLTSLGNAAIRSQQDQAFEKSLQVTSAKPQDGEPRFDITFRGPGLHYFFTSQADRQDVAALAAHVEQTLKEKEAQTRRGRATKPRAVLTSR